MKMKLISLKKISPDKFDLVLQIDESIEKMQISIFENEGIWGIEGAEFEKLLWNSGSAEENQHLIAEINQKYFALKKISELQAA